VRERDIGEGMTVGPREGMSKSYDSIGDS